MNDLPAPASPSTALAANKPMSEMERFAQALVTQQDLINALDEKTQVSRNVLPSEPSKPENDQGVHISTLINIVEKNNRDLRQIVDEIIL